MKFTKPSAPTIADLCIMVITFSGETHATSASFMPSHAPALNSMQLDRMEFLDRFKNFIVKITLWLYLNIHMKIQVRILEFFSSFNPGSNSHCTTVRPLHFQYMNAAGKARQR